MTLLSRVCVLPQHSMIYFFHHYELPAILQQIRIQEMLLQNQQGAQNQNQQGVQDQNQQGAQNQQDVQDQNQQEVQDQTAPHDNLNNSDAAAGPGPADTPQPGAASSEDTPTAPLTQPHPSSPTGAVGGAGEPRAELNWVAQTAAIITGALVSTIDLGGGGGGGAVGGELGGPEDPNVVSLEVKPTEGGGADTPAVRGLQGAEPSETAPPHTDCTSSQSSGTDYNLRAPEWQQSSAS